MFRRKRIFLYSLMILFGFSGLSKMAWGLVDYTDQSMVPKTQKAPSKALQKFKKASRTKSFSTNKSTSSFRFFKSFELSHYYEVLDVKTTSQGKAHALKLDGRFETQYDFYLDFGSSWWQTSEQNLASKDSFQSGPPHLVLGLHWIDSGPSDPRRTQLDIYMGGKFKITNSSYAPSRNDKILGVITSKRFNPFVLGFQGEWINTGRPQKNDETEIGDLYKVGVAVAWIVSMDIKLMLEGHYYKIKAASTDSEYALKNDVSFSGATAKLLLGMVPAFDFVLGTKVRTNKMPSDPSLMKAGLYQYDYGMGNSIFFGLTFTM